MLSLSQPCAEYMSKAAHFPNAVACAWYKGSALPLLPPHILSSIPTPSSTAMSIDDEIMAFLSIDPILESDDEKKLTIVSKFCLRPNSSSSPTALNPVKIEIADMDFVLERTIVSSAPPSLEIGHAEHLRALVEAHPDALLLVPIEVVNLIPDDIKNTIVTVNAKDGMRFTDTSDGFRKTYFTALHMHARV